MGDSQRDQDLAAWAASPSLEEEIAAGRATVLTGEEARAAGRELMERVTRGQHTQDAKTGS